MIQQRACPPAGAQHSAEWVGDYHEPAHSVSSPPQLLSLVETGFILVNAERQHVPQIGLYLHGPNQNYAVTAGKGFELMAFPRSAVLSDAQTTEAQSLRFENKVLGVQAAIAASFGGVYVEIEKSGH